MPGEFGYLQTKIRENDEDILALKKKVEKIRMDIDRLNRKIEKTHSEMRDIKEVSDIKSLRMDIVKEIKEVHKAQSDRGAKLLTKMFAKKFDKVMSKMAEYIVMYIDEDTEEGHVRIMGLIDMLIDYNALPYESLLKYEQHCNKVRKEMEQAQKNKKILKRAEKFAGKLKKALGGE